MLKNRKHLNSISNKYVWLMNADTRSDNIAAIFIAFFGIQIVGMGIDAAQAVALNQDQFKTEWKNIRSENINKWLNLGTFISLIILFVCIIEMCASSHEAKHFAELAIKRYAHQHKINISNINKKDLCDIANLVLSRTSDQDKTQILNKCAGLREELYIAEAQRLKNEITQPQYNKICKSHLVEMTNYITPIIQKTIANNPALGELLQNMIDGKTKYMSPEMFKPYQK